MRSKYLTYDQKRAAEKLFEKHMIPREDQEGAWQWEIDDDGTPWNDERVAKEIGSESPAQIAAFRTDRKFPLQVRSAPGEKKVSKVDILVEEMDELRRTVIASNDNVKVLEQKVHAGMNSLHDALKRITLLEADLDMMKRPEELDFSREDKQRWLRAVNPQKPDGAA